MKRHLLTLIFLLTAGKFLFAQNPYIQHYTNFDGLPSDMVYQVYQDSKKFIWFATDAGVARYDGSSFLIFQKKDGLSNNEVVKIKEDAQGRIWFFTLGGSLNFYYQNKIYNEKNTPFLGLLKCADLFRNFYQDKDQTLYFFYNHNRDIYSLDSKNHVKKYNFASRLIKNGGNDIPFEGMMIRDLRKNKNGEFILWTPIGMMKTKSLSIEPQLIGDTIWVREILSSKNNKTLVEIYYNNKTSFKLLMYQDEVLTESVILPVKSTNMGYIAVFDDQAGYRWVSTFDQGVFCLKGNKIIRHFDIKEALGITQDHENNIWISSMKEGVFKISQYLNVHLHFEKTDFENMGISAITQSNDNNLWLTNGKSVYLMKNQQFYKLDYNNNENYFNQLFQLKSNTLIVGEKSADYIAFSGISLDNTRKKVVFKKYYPSTYHLKNFVVNHDETEMYASAGTVVRYFNTSQLFKEIKYKSIYERISNIFYNKNNELIINARKNYLFRNFKLFPYKPLEKLNNQFISDYLILNDSTELFNIEGDSIYLCRNHKFYNLTAAFHYPIDLQIRNLIYKEPTLYLATPKNIFKCDFPANIIHKMPVYLQPIDIGFRNINDILYWKDSLLIASDDGLTIIPSYSIPGIKNYIPIPYFQTISVNDVEIDPLKKSVEITGNNRFRFDFSSVSYSSQNVIFSYKLEGADLEWTTGKGNNVVYQNLPNGTYTFKLRARKPTSTWSQPIEFHIVIHAPFWKKPLFLVFLLLLMAGFISIIIIYRKNLQIKHREIDYTLITLEQKALQSMMNPHFIFNSLGSIQYLLLQKRGSEASLYLAQFARLIRQNLSSINTATIQLEDEIDRLKNYLDLEKLRLEDKFDYTIQIDEQMNEEDVYIPSMVIQPFVENAIWHGIAGIDSKGEIIVSFSMPNLQTIMIIIEDNGIGMKKSQLFSKKKEQHINMGVTLTKKRLEILGKKFNVNTRIDYYEKNPGEINPGTRVIIIVPSTKSDVALA